jgi:hypothetical protein
VPLEEPPTQGSKRKYDSHARRHGKTGSTAPHPKCI